ncbi:histone H1-like [Centruroides vittatus]|uniref:histone H1-like n=1 Tax=Centruroides vittatus TaxID=120091 RepID=UPI00350EE17B
MTDTEGATTGNSVPPIPKKSKGRARKSKNAQNHPKISEMVIEAITELKERNGSSLQAIKKYVGANFKVDVEKLAPFIKKYLKTAVVNGVLMQTKGHGATGSFKLSVSMISQDKPKSREEPKKKSKNVVAASKKGAKPKKIVKKTKVKVEKKVKSAKTPKKPKAKPVSKSKKSKESKKKSKK